MRSAVCKRELLGGYLTKQLDLEGKLEFLIHVDSCPRCWDEVYNATKAEHPHFYKKSSSRQFRVSERDLRHVDDYAEEIIEVA